MFVYSTHDAMYLLVHSKIVIPFSYRRAFLFILNIFSYNCSFIPYLCCPVKSWYGMFYSISFQGKVNIQNFTKSKCKFVTLCDNIK